ncbi:hypothetical protein AOXY_G33964 [Acipenser oxyrinchus oxyrinchus]|uniref:Uncharacterized protein n=1 Tax=Acipenser oxyrinchus oxyrinchus TaxID=40147 RepID=A0AAD8CH32_ACIOX|nr:hypothetical protein AOXY_G33964 [Acipenser oxyrinchus oxyrinchus]
MDRTPRRRRNSYEYDKPNMSEDHDRGNIQVEEQERRTVNLAASRWDCISRGWFGCIVTCYIRSPDASTSHGDWRCCWSSFHDLH